MAGLVGYGGDPRIVASRNEIERVSANLSLVGQDLFQRLFDLLPNPIHRAQLDAHLPDFTWRIHKTRLALAAAAENYFSEDARVAHSIEQTAHTLRDHPWLLNLLPPGTREELEVAGVVGFAAAQFAPGDTASGATRFLAASNKQDLGFMPDPLVSVHRVSVEAGVPTKTLSSIGAKLDALNNKNAQIRIERYEMVGGKALLLVLIPGTQTLNPLAGRNPFDVSSDARLASHPENSQLVLAIDKAIEKAGGKDAKVILAGYSLGGMAAAAVAAKGKFDVSGVITIGSPVGHIKVPGDVPVLSIQHSNDPVPAATGVTNPLASNWATASRQFELELGQPALDAHDISNYRQTLALAEATPIAGVTRVREMIFGQLAKAKLVEVSGFELLRDSR